MYWDRPKLLNESTKSFSVGFWTKILSSSGHVTLLRLKSPRINIFFGFLLLKKDPMEFTIES